LSREILLRAFPDLLCLHRRRSLLVADRTGAFGGGLAGLYGHDLRRTGHDRARALSTCPWGSTQHRRSGRPCLLSQAIVGQFPTPLPTVLPSRRLGAAP
jgi:hypothetical protein